MRAKRFTFLNKKVWLIAAMVLSFAGAAGCGKNYRTVAVEEVSGNVTAKSEKRDGTINKGEHLYSGDFVTVSDVSALTMCADQNKFLYADANTSFAVENTSSKKNSNLKFVMSSGSTLHEISEKLGEGDTYEVDTPNSTMSVRGTKFRVTVYKGSDGMIYTLTEVESGAVLVRLKTEDGTYTGVERVFEAGESALIRGNEFVSEFVPGNFKQETWILDYPHLPKGSIERLVKLITDGSLIPEDYPHEHALSDWEVVTEPECETAGKKVKKCTLCGKITESEEIAAKGHSAGDWTVETDSTCEAEGTRVKKCENCGLVMETETIAMKKHEKSDEWTVTVEAGCKTKGTEARLCIYCGKEMETRTVKAAGHKYGEWEVTKEATCTEKGSRKRICTVCGEEVSESVKALGHSYKETGRVDATCTANGKINKKCSRCGKTAEEEIAALGHSYDSWVTVAPTCGASGTGHSRCSRCGAENDYTIQPTGNHVWEEWQYFQPPIATNDPSLPDFWTHVCSVCGTSETTYTNPN